MVLSRFLKCKRSWKVCWCLIISWADVVVYFTTVIYQLVWPKYTSQLYKLKGTEILEHFRTLFCVKFANFAGDNIRFAPPLTLLIVNNTHKKISFAYLCQYLLLNLALSFKFLSHLAQKLHFEKPSLISGAINFG